MDVHDVRTKPHDGAPDLSRRAGRPHRFHSQGESRTHAGVILDLVVVDDKPLDTMTASFEESRLGVEDGVLAAELSVAVVDREDGIRDGGWTDGLGHGPRVVAS